MNDLRQEYLQQRCDYYHIPWDDLIDEQDFITWLAGGDEEESSELEPRMTTKTKNGLSRRFR